MNILLLIPYYASWHYSYALKNIVQNSKNILWFIGHFFSIQLLLRTLFAPWQRLNDTYKGGLDIESFFSTLVVNTLMRIVGAGIRLFVISIGLVSLVVAAISFIAFFLVWLVLPFVMVFFFLASLYSLL